MKNYLTILIISSSILLVSCTMHPENKVMEEYSENKIDSEKN